MDAETATPEMIEAIIGNGSWTRLTCDECKKDVDAILTVGDAPDYESNTASLCRKCVEKASSFSWDNAESSHGDKEARP